MEKDKTLKTRREAIKKIGQAAAFVVPTIATINVSEVHACSSVFSTYQISNHYCWNRTNFFNPDGHYLKWFDWDWYKQDSCVSHLSNYWHQNYYDVWSYCANRWRR